MLGHKIWVLGLAGLVLAATPGCKLKRFRNYDKAADEAVVIDGDARVDVSGSDATNLNPVIAGDSVSLDVCGLVFNGLLRYNPKLELEGELAKSWEVKEKGLKIIFHLRPGVLWHDGEPFTSADVAFTLKTIMDPKVATPRKGPFELVAGVATPDPLTVIVRYKKPFAPALESWGQQIIPKHLLDGKDLSKCGFNQNPIGTGPYKFVRWKPNESIELAANPKYFEGKPHIDKYLYRIIPEPATQLLEMRTQGLDYISSLTPDQYKTLLTDKVFGRADRLFHYPSLSTYTYFGFNLLKPMFQDIRVRKALSMAIDRQALIDLILLGYGRPCSGPYVSSMPAYNQAVRPVEYNLDQAAGLLDQAGWKRGPDGYRAKSGTPLAFSIVTNQGNKVRADVATVMQEQFKKLGVKVEVRVLEFPILLEQYIYKKNFDTVVMGWQLSLDPDQYDIWHSSKTHEKEFNFISYKNPELDKLLENGRTTFDTKQRMDIYHHVHAILARDEPVCFLFSPDSLSALHKRYRGLLVTDTGVDWYWPERWYVPKSLQFNP